MSDGIKNLKISRLEEEPFPSEDFDFLLEGTLIFLFFFFTQSWGLWHQIAIDDKEYFFNSLIHTQPVLLKGIR